MAVVIQTHHVPILGPVPIIALVTLDTSITCLHQPVLSAICAIRPHRRAKTIVCVSTPVLERLIVYVIAAIPPMLTYPIFYVFQLTTVLLTMVAVREIRHAATWDLD